MSEPVFVDASAWVAITNRRDRNHNESVRIDRYRDKTWGVEPRAREMTRFRISEALRRKVRVIIVGVAEVWA